MKRLILALALMGSPAMADEYQEGLNMGSWIAFCNAHRNGDYKDPGLARHMVLSSYDSLDEANKAWARDFHPTCTRN